ncbi:MAG: DUF1351 domain-containing protein [Bilophila wadsworthia]
MAQTAEILEALPPAQMQPTGLAQFDLNVTATPLVITWDKDAVSTLLDTVLAQYAGLEVQEADVPAIKNEMAGLNRLKERMDNARKDIKRRIAGPLDGFDAEVKALIARIVDARAALDTQVKDFERRDREGRRAAVQCVVDNIKSCEGVPELDIPINPSWLNKSTRQAEIHEDIKRSSPHTGGVRRNRRMEQASRPHRAGGGHGELSTTRFRASPVEVCGLPDAGHFRGGRRGHHQAGICGGSQGPRREQAHPRRQTCGAAPRFVH